jgi:hypothetical protein
LNFLFSNGTRTVVATLNRNMNYMGRFGLQTYLGISNSIVQVYWPWWSW